MSQFKEKRDKLIKNFIENEILTLKTSKGGVPLELDVRKLYRHIETKVLISDMYEEYWNAGLINMPDPTVFASPDFEGMNFLNVFKPQAPVIFLSIHPHSYDEVVELDSENNTWNVIPAFGRLTDVNDLKKIKSRVNDIHGNIENSLVLIDCLPKKAVGVVSFIDMTDLYKFLDNNQEFYLNNNITREAVYHLQKYRNGQEWDGYVKPETKKYQRNGSR